MLKIRYGRKKGAFALLTGRYVEDERIIMTSGLKYFRDNIKALECLINLKGRLIDGTITYEDNLPEIESMLRILEPVCLLVFTEEEAQEILDFIVSSTNMSVRINQLPSFSLEDLGIYQKLIWKQITKSLLNGEMDEEIAKLKTIIKKDTIAFKELISRRRKEIKEMTMCYDVLEGILTLSPMENSEVETIKR